jgi:hypothetical protein
LSIPLHLSPKLQEESVKTSSKIIENESMKNLVFVFIGTEVSLANVASVIRVLAVNTHIVAAPVTIVILISCVYAAAHNRFTVVAEVILISIRAGGQND